MDNKNVFVAIALSMSVLLFWGAFFEPPRKPVDQKIIKMLKEKLSKTLLLLQLANHKLLKNLQEKNL